MDDRKEINVNGRGNRVWVSVEVVVYVFFWLGRKIVQRLKRTQSLVRNVAALCTRNKIGKTYTPFLFLLLFSTPTFITSKEIIVIY